MLKVEEKKKDNRVFNFSPRDTEKIKRARVVHEEKKESVPEVSQEVTDEVPSVPFLAFEDPMFLLEQPLHGEETFPLLTLPDYFSQPNLEENNSNLLSIDNSSFSNLALPTPLFIQI